MPKLQEQKQVTVEKLLELKKFERPSSEFWTRFENDLQVKRLQALVEKPSWLDRLRAALRYTMIWAVPVGGAAALAFALWVHSGELKWLQGGTANSELTARTMSESGQLASQDPLRELTDAALAREESALLRLETSVQSANLASASPQFIMDALSSEDSQPTHFRRVMYSSDFSADRDKGSRYVADPIPASRGAVVQPAVFTSSSRNF
ncbi:MAG: hypothetical protein JJU20_05680 [Opitutales bacterium]|nr:hypothetical protein [Opitutales bacterium]